MVHLTLNNLISRRKFGSAILSLTERFKSENYKSYHKMLFKLWESDFSSSTDLYRGESICDAKTERLKTNLSVKNYFQLFILDSALFSGTAIREAITHFARSIKINTEVSVAIALSKSVLT